MGCNSRVTMVTMNGMKHTNHSEIIDLFGGSSKTAQIFGISSQAVSKWKRTKIPASRLMCLKLLRPDLFSEEKKAA